MVSLDWGLIKSPNAPERLLAFEYIFVSLPAQFASETNVVCL
jgi:hypothetical protein